MCASSRWLPTIQCSGEYGKSLGRLQIIYNIEVTKSKLRPHLEGSLRFRRQPDPRTVTSSKTYHPVYHTYGVQVSLYQVLRDLFFRRVVLPFSLRFFNSLESTSVPSGLSSVTFRSDCGFADVTSVLPGLGICSVIAPSAGTLP
jgi:hypothetical protein